MSLHRAQEQIELLIISRKLKKEKERKQASYDIIVYAYFYLIRIRLVEWTGLTAEEPLAQLPAGGLLHAAAPGSRDATRLGCNG